MPSADLSRPYWTCLNLSGTLLHVPDEVGPLARAVKARRLALGLSQGDLAAKGGPKIVTVRQIERGHMRNPRDLTLAALDRALDWQQGSAASVAEGGVATPLPIEPVTPPDEDAGYVRDPGTAPAGITDEDLVALIRRQRDELDQMLRRLGREPLDGPG